MTRSLTYTLTYDEGRRAYLASFAWLGTVSDAGRGFNAFELEFLIVHLPVCAVNCTDGTLYHTVLGAWCVPWAQVPKAPFLAAWFALSPSTRRALLQDSMVFAEELHEDLWLQRLLDRDDVAMFAALPNSALAAASAALLLFAPHTNMVLSCIERGAHRCLAHLAKRKGWAPFDWARHITEEKLLPVGSDEFTACGAAAAGGHVSMLMLLRAKGGCLMNERTACTAAARGGQLESLRYAHGHGCPWNEMTCAQAAAGGHLECLQYAHEHGCPWNETTCDWAAKNGHSACLEYACSHGCPRDEQSCAWAALKGRLACLQYLHERGRCPWDEQTCACAAFSGHLECLQYAHVRGCPFVG